MTSCLMPPTLRMTLLWLDLALRMTSLLGMVSSSVRRDSLGSMVWRAMSGRGLVQLQTPASVSDEREERCQRSPEMSTGGLLILEATDSSNSSLLLAWLS